MQFSNVLVLSPHTDDSELCCGGFISKLINDGAKVTVILFSNPVESLTHNTDDKILLNEFKRACGVLKTSYKILDFKVREFHNNHDSIRDIMYLENQNNYDLVLCPCDFDNHQDHEVINQEAKRIFRKSTILGYESPQNHCQITAPYYVHLTKENLSDKCSAISQYQSQINRPYFKIDFTRSLSIVRGLQSGTKYAELYQTIKIINRCVI